MTRPGSTTPRRNGVGKLASPAYRRPGQRLCPQHQLRHLGPPGAGRDRHRRRHLHHGRGLMTPTAGSPRSAIPPASSPDTPTTVSATRTSFRKPPPAHRIGRPTSWMPSGTSCSRPRRWPRHHAQLRPATGRLNSIATGRARQCSCRTSPIPTICSAIRCRARMPTFEHVRELRLRRAQPADLVDGSAEPASLGKDLRLQTRSATCCRSRMSAPTPIRRRARRGLMR